MKIKKEAMILFLNKIKLLTIGIICNIVFIFAENYKRTIMLRKLFGFNPKETTVKTEIMAGITTFLTMAYILAVNPNILGDAGMDKEAVFTTTVLVSAVATMLMGL